MLAVKKNQLWVTMALALALPLILWAAGGGGGGGGGGVSGPPPCDADTWECTNWAACQLDGIQARLCNLTFDCPTANTPKPPTTQSCTPACTEDLYSCANWGPCDASGKQLRTCGKTSDCPLVETPKPIEEQSCQPACTADTWECTGYGACVNGKQIRTCALSFDCPTVSTPKPEESKTCVVPKVAPKGTCAQDRYECGDWGQCNENGRQTRTCTLLQDCPGVSTPKPEESRVCPGLKCGHLPTLRERISCRLRLSNQELANEFKILYAPEACKAFRDDPAEKLDCIKLYQQLGPCWQISVGSARNACAKKTIGLDDIAKEKSRCAKLSGEARDKCLVDLNEKVKYFTVFRMYDLEVRAETLMDRGAPQDLVTNLETFIETKKQELYKSDNPQEWKRMAQAAQAKWREFVNKARPFLK